MTEAVEAKAEIAPVNRRAHFWIPPIIIRGICWQDGATSETPAQMLRSDSQFRGRLGVGLRITVKAIAGLVIRQEH